MTPPLRHLNKTQALLFVLFAYLVALGVAAASMAFWPDSWPSWQTAFAADVVGTVVIYLFSISVRNSSMYDAYWSVAPAPLALYWWLAPETDGVVFLRAAFALFVVFGWGIRLTYNWAKHWPGLDHEDWRYVAFREKLGPLFPIVDFFGIHFFPTVQVFLGCVPVYLAVSVGDAPLGIFDYLGLAIGTMGWVVEGVADRQLHDFVARRKPGQIMNEGLWKYSRHPNYFGECTVWWGLALLGWGAVPGNLWAFGGAVAITVMFVFVSIPLLDKRSAERREGYAEHMKKVSALIPLPPRRG